MTTVYFAVEGRTDVPVAQRLVRLVGCEPHQAIVAKGKSKLDLRVPDLNASGTHLNWLILRDLDHDALCPSQLIRTLLKEHPPSPRVAIRTPVRTAESWLLADRVGIAKQFSVPLNNVPSDTDGLDKPRQALVNLCRASRNRDIRAGMAPRAGSGRQVGPEYTDRVSEFARLTWDPERAAETSRSLRSAIVSLRRLVTEEIWS